MGPSGRLQPLPADCGPILRRGGARGKLSFPTRVARSGIQRMIEFALDSRFRGNDRWRYYRFTSQVVVPSLLSLSAMPMALSFPTRAARSGIQKIDEGCSWIP